MINFEKQYFRKFNFDESQLKRFLSTAKRDLKIARDSKIAEVVFKFSYDAFIKLGIAIIAFRGHKVRSVIGHHMKVIEKLAEILDDEDIAVIGNKIRQTRNFDFYDGGTEITEKDSEEYLRFVENIGRKVSEYLKN